MKTTTTLPVIHSIAINRAKVTYMDEAATAKIGYTNQWQNLEFNVTGENLPLDIDIANIGLTPVAATVNSVTNQSSTGFTVTASLNAAPGATAADFEITTINIPLHGYADLAAISANREKYNVKTVTSFNAPTYAHAQNATNIDTVANTLKLS